MSGHDLRQGSAFRPGALIRALAAAAAGREPDPEDLATLTPEARRGFLGAFNPQGASLPAVAAAQPAETQTHPRATETQTQPETQGSQGFQDIQKTQERRHRAAGYPQQLQWPDSGAEWPTDERALEPACPEEAFSRELARRARDLAEHPPTGEGSPPFKLARRLKAWSEALRCGPQECLRALDLRNPRWWVSFAERGDTRDDVIDKFIDAWEQIRFPEGDDPVSVALRQGAAQPLVAVGSFAMSPEFNRFLSFLRALAECVQEERGAFFLPCGYLGRIFGCSAASVWRWRKQALRHGVIVKARAKGNKRRLADEFRVDFQRLSELTEPG